MISYHAARTEDASHGRLFYGQDTTIQPTCIIVTRCKSCCFSTCDYSAYSSSPVLCCRTCAGLGRNLRILLETCKTSTETGEDWALGFDASEFERKKECSQCR
uniref:Uncharacterized protein n=1 Tax=Cacopsylla melanoneura TaxID=428564 RepID=A0A8D8REC6_9HEMI